MQSKALHILSILILTVGMVTTARAQGSHPTPQEEKDGILGYKPQSRIKIAGNVYGGGDQAAVEGNTNVIINTGEYGGEIFGGGNGAMEADGVTVKRSADVGKHDAITGELVPNTGDTHVTINGGEIIYYFGSGTDNNHNIYGGGNMACNVAGNTHVTMNKGMITAWSFVSTAEEADPKRNAALAWQSWFANNKEADQKAPVAAVFGAGYGANTDVAQSTNVEIDFGETHVGEYSKEDLVDINGYVVKARPNTLLSQQFVTSVLGGGYNGTVGAYSVADKGINRDKDEYIANTNVTIQGSPYMFNVFGGGLGSKEAADRDGNKWDSHVGAVYGGTKVDIQGGFIYGDVFGGGAGINGQMEVALSPEHTGMMPYINAAQVFRETDVTISGNGTVIIGNVYGGGDIANTGWYTAAARPIGTDNDHQEQENMSLAKLDYTTSLKLKGGNIMGAVFAGANGRKKVDIAQTHLIGAVIGSTNLTFGNDDESGATVWNNIYAGGNAGCVYSCADIAAAKNDAGNARAMASYEKDSKTFYVKDGCTNAAFLGGKMAKDIFGGGFGDVSKINPAEITSADISGNTYVYFKQGRLEFEEYWDPTSGTFKTQTSKGAARNTESDICHNLYGGGNVACIVKGNTHVHMEGAPSAPPSFALLDYYEDCISNVAKPHFSSFGGGFGMHAEVRGDTHSDINLKYGTGMHSIIGGGMNGPVGGYTKVHVGSDPSLNIHHVYGGGYYASCKGTQLDITRGNIVENVFGGSVMGNINEDGEITDIVTETTIGLQTPGDGRHSSANLEDENDIILRSYTYEQHKNEITIGGNVYGANDVSGTVNGIAKLTIYGGTFKSEVYGAGNGNHIGYYIPAQLRYDLGEHDNNYYYVDHSDDNGPKGNTYVSRPQTLGGVELTLEGNTETERVSVLGQVFGGGNSCTIGEWDKSMIAAEGKYHGDPHLTRDDPEYFRGGGKIDIMLGSHVTIGRKRSVLNTASDGSKYIDNDENVSGLFMGCSGKDLATQSGAKTDNHYHHFFSPYAKQYLPGFLVYDEHGIAKDREEQLKPFQAYLNNILVWTDNINLRFRDNAEDIWLANFVGGGFRGSMRLKTGEGRFDYQLPIGVTVNHAIIGGAYNSHVKYKLFDTNNEGKFVDSDGDDAWDYATTVPSDWVLGVDYLGELKEDPDDPTKVTAILRYNYNGGMLAENSTGVNSSDVSAHIHTVHADPRTNPIAYETAYFEPKKEGQDGREDEEIRAKLFTANKNKTLLYLQLNCALEPEVFEADAKHDSKYANGGNVYGGCFSSGFVEGDSWVDYSCWLSPKCTDQTFFGKQNNLEIYAEVADLDRNNAMSVFGAGFGTDTHSMGDVYLRIKNIDNAALGDADPNGKFPYIYNAFGGSNMGEVDGNVNVYYDTGAQGTLLGSLYGGSYQGGIGGNTFVELASGFLFNVYGGSRKADINGASHVWAYDGFYRGAPDAQHLIVCNLYGGNDIAGTIEGTMPIAFTKEKWNGYAKRPEVTLADDEVFNTYVEVSTDSKSERGFPLIGSAYAGGNGLNWSEDAGDKPEVEKALIEIGGGSTLNAFGGGNMATVTGKTCIFANAEGDTYADVNFTEYQKYIVQNVFFNGMKRGYRWDGTRLIMDPFHVMNLFGGNNLATMDIQPTWNLAKGRLENVYSGGNMGDMTYYNPAGKPATRDGMVGSPSGVENNADGSNSNYTPRGLTITVEQPDIFIQSLFGGCRMSNVTPTPKGDDIVNNPWPTTNADDYYGATVNVTDGYINNIYGGNDISGTVTHGTNVNISGAVSGNVYGSGNGFYLYKYDPEVTQVTEELDNSDGGYGIYYRVPETDANGDLLDERGTPSTDTHKILTINAIRPSVEKAFLNIGGLEHYTYKDQYGQDSIAKRVAYVKGNVFCGGNASTITGDGSFSKFKIGSFVTLNGVFMGSDGLAYTENDEIARFAKINGITDMGAETHFESGYELDKQHNPILLNTYMMAVDMLAQPRDFNLNLPLKEAHIGTYCGGGNRGSMLVDKTVELPFHHDIIIYDKIVGACLNANVEYNQNGKIITSYGGYTRAIDLANNGANGNTKMRLNIASQFVPLVMDVPDDKNDETLNSHGENFKQAKAHDFLYDNRTEGVKYTYEEFNELFEPTEPYTSQAEFEEKEGIEHQWKEAPGIYAPSCNIYGGCYQSGEVEGDIELNLYSNMLRYVDKEDLDKSLAQNIACFNVYGAGFGQNSHVWGNVKINMDRCLDTSTMGDPVAESNLSPEIATLLGGASNWDVQHSTTPAENMLGIANAYQYPSFNNIIGGGRNGKLIGNSTVEIRNGLVYSDVAGGCYASDMYGSTHVIVGYPQYWECNNSGEYDVQRGDTWNTTKEDVYGGKVVKQTIKYLKGDLVPNNMYEQIIAAGGASSNFTPVNVTPTTRHTSDGTTWNDIHIKIGKGVYGGGYSLANSTAASAGSITTHKLKDDDIDLHPHNFDGRPYYNEATSSYNTFAEHETIGYGGNSSIMVGDQEDGTTDHIHISTLNVTPLPKPYTASTKIGKYVLEAGKYTHQGDGAPDPAVQYYDLAGDGGLYGDGHLTFCEGFRSADVTRYGWAEGTAKHPVLLNTFQRMDLLSINDCCLMLQGAQDFATDQIDATVYSITRINELRMNSSLSAGAPLGQISAQNGLGGVGKNFDDVHQRNYLAFFNNVHYLGSIVTNDKFDDAEHTFHDANGSLGTMSYKAKKQNFISTYSSSPKQSADVTAFKHRNVGTARNAIGINNGYCLRIQNQEYVGSGDEKQSQTYYGPIVGVCEVKLLTLVQGEGGGYVYADNIHNDPTNFLMTSGNFVFPGIVSSSDDIGDQYIVDDCFLKHFGTTTNLTQKDGELDEAHYWYVEGNKYFFTTTLTGFTYQEALDFNLTDNDPNIILSGMENGSHLNIKKIEWLSTHRKNYECVLENATPDKIDDYEFDIQIGGVTASDWASDMPRHSAGNDDAEANWLTSGKTIQNDNLPQFNILLQDKLDNSGDAKYINHLDEPEVVKIYLEGKTKDELDNWQTYEYTITLNIVYLQGPTFEGGVRIENCALPGEWINFSSDGLDIKTPELMPITAASWQIVPLQQIDEHGVWHWDISNGTVIPGVQENLAGNMEGHITALYKQNEYTIAYIFTAGGKNFPVMPKQTNPKKEQRMIVVHNYHRMKDVVPQNLQIETMVTVPNHSVGGANEVYHPDLAQAKLYIEDEEDLRAFINYLNMATSTYTDDGGVVHAGNEYNIPVGLTGLDIILQKDIMLTSALPAISVPFAGNFHGDGYHIDLGEHGTSFLGDKLTGKVYNLGLVGGTIATTGTRTNCYEYVNSDAFTYGQMAYDLSHYFTPTHEGDAVVADADNYVKNRYANGDYQYATTDRVWSLRTGAPNYGQADTRHDKSHTHDADRWDDADDVKDVDVLAEEGTNTPLYNGTKVIYNVNITDDIGEVKEVKYGFPTNYANDYLFFGQHLDKANADAYPVHIEPVANGDSDASKGGNRVYKTSGFYGSATDQGFYYNKDAWALQKELTAIDFTFRNGDENNNTWTKVSGRYKEGDDTSTGGVTKEINQPLAFQVDSNADYNGGTYDNASYGHVTQNLIVVGENAIENPAQATVLAAGTYVDGTPEEDIRYHRVQLKSGEIHQYEIDYFHLVDKQDFNSPVSSTVNTRAWYERYPQAYRNADPYTGASAWEGITLPFMYTTKVSGEPQEIGGTTYENVLSHFYGETTAEMDANPALNDRTLHHEYWLTGLIRADDGKVTFARPSAYDGQGNFYVPGSAMPYEYENLYYRHLPDYDHHYDSRDDEGADVMDEHSNAWYAKSHTFVDYPYQFHGVPYLCAFPGNDYYEFSLEGDAGAGTHNQKVTFEVGRTIIAVSDVDIRDQATTSVGTHKHVGTYQHVTADATHLGINVAGNAFEVGNEILPFRTYMTTTAPLHAPRRIVIADSGEQMIAEPDVEDGPGLVVTINGLHVTIHSTYQDSRNFTVHDVAGRTVLRHTAVPGDSSFDLPRPGIYLIAGRKYFVR